MMRPPMKKITALIVFAVIGFAGFAYAHSGGLDKNGGHHDRKTGGYHKH